MTWWNFGFVVSVTVITTSRNRTIAPITVCFHFRGAMWVKVVCLSVVLI